jgi:hypothetical protein
LPANIRSDNGVPFASPNALFHLSKALQMKYPAEIYRPSPRPYTGLPDIDYPFHDKTIMVTRWGRICLGSKKINLSQVFASKTSTTTSVWSVS